MAVGPRWPVSMGQGAHRITPRSSRSSARPLASRCRLELLRVVLAELRELGRDHELTVGLVGVLVVVRLVVVLGRIELSIWNYLGHDRRLEGMLLLERRDGLDRRGALRRGVEEDRGAVLSPGVGALPVQRRWIDEGEEHVEQVAVRDHRGVEGDLHGLGMTRRSGADALIAR